MSKVSPRSPLVPNDRNNSGTLAGRFTECPYAIRPQPSPAQRGWPPSTARIIAPNARACQTPSGGHTSPDAPARAGGIAKRSLLIRSSSSADRTRSARGRRALWGVSRRTRDRRRRCGIATPIPPPARRWHTRFADTRGQVAALRKVHVHLCWRLVHARNAEAVEVLLIDTPPPRPSIPLTLARGSQDPLSLHKYRKSRPLYVARLQADPPL